MIIIKYSITKIIKLLEFPTNQPVKLLNIPFSKPPFANLTLRVAPSWNMVPTNARQITTDAISMMNISIFKL